MRKPNVSMHLLLPCLQNLARTENGPAPVSELERQNAEAWVKRAGGKPIYDEGEPKVGIWESAFTRRREIFIGRLAMVGKQHGTPRIVPLPQLMATCL
jgi:hypothetical protein